jgi:hypothetical protein
MAFLQGPDSSFLGMTTGLPFLLAPATGSCIWGVVSALDLMPSTRLSIQRTKNLGSSLAPIGVEPASPVNPGLKVDTLPSS